MPLSAGTTFGNYEIVSAIGAGGMGEVYRARDGRLKRDVALKVLPETFSTDPERLARFEREAEVLAALNHPHIAAIYGLQEAGGLNALVMELVEGEDLAALIARGPIPLEEALSIAKQIGDALDTAHQCGIIHRDLKPANIKVRSDGTVKVLDFGLAKTVDAPTSGVSSNSATLTSPAMTAQGVILGTAAYMAPEQARGQRVDKRVDIWAFGVVLFEMLTGRSPFPCDDVTETIAAIVKAQPDLSGVPRVARRLVGKCLEKDPARRLRDIGDLWELLDLPSSEATSQTGPALRMRALWVAGVVLAGGALGLLASPLILRRESVPIRPHRSALTLPEGRAMPPLGPAGGTSIALSPDGRTLVYVARENGEWRLFRKFADELEAAPIGDVNPRDPFFSPDGQWVGFRAHGTETLRRVPARGGPAQTIARVFHRGASWNTDGTIILGGGSSGLLRVSEIGGNVGTLATPGSHRRIWYPQLLPGGRAVLYTESPDEADAGELWILELATGIRKRLVSGSAGRYLPTGHLVFTAQRTLWAVAFDTDRLVVRGTPVPVGQGIRVNPDGGAVDMALAEAGVLAYVAETTGAKRQLMWVDRDGKEDPVGVEPRAYSNPRVSPDGTRIAVTMRDEGRDVWIWDIPRRRLRQFTSDTSPNFLAVWLDDHRLAFSAIENGTTQVFVRSADGSDEGRRLTNSPHSTFPVASSRDGSVLFLQTSRGPAESPAEIELLSVQNPQPRGTTGPRVSGINPAPSPDGRWLAYQRSNKIYVRPLPLVGDSEHLLTTKSGTAPVWARDGRELYYWMESSGVVSIMGVSTAPGPPANWGSARPIVRGNYVQVSTDTQYDVWDGRFLLMKAVAPLGTSARDEIVIVLNWHEELKRLVPTK